ncbi:MAG: glycoside hydrolase [Polyangiaceae bacterium]
MSAPLGGGAALQLWGGVECTVNRVGDRYFDQLTRSGHRHRLDDFDRFAALGLRKLRMPVLWESIASRGDTGWLWADAAMGRMQAVGIDPVVGLLHHGSGPPDTSLLDPGFAAKAARHARAVAERYPHVIEWTPVNEPVTTARFAALYGHWYPHARSAADFVRAVLSQVQATVACMRAIRAVTPTARLVQTEDFGRVFGTPALAGQVLHESERRFLAVDLLCGRVDSRHPLWKWLRANGATERELLALCDAPCPPDLVGINYYVTSDRWLDDRCERYPACTHGGNGRQRYADVEAVRVVDPSAVSHLEVLLEVWQRYRRPVALTEVHIGCSADERARWLVEAWRAACEARDRGADVRAITAWALLGSYDWDVLVREHLGNYEPGVLDVSCGVPRATATTSLVKCLAQGRIPTDPALTAPGWWRRPERLLYPSNVRQLAPAAGTRLDRALAARNGHVPPGGAARRQSA